MGRKEDLEQHIRESYQLIRGYEEILQTSDNPKKKASARRDIEEQRRLIETWSAEYEQIAGRMPPAPPTEPINSSKLPVSEVLQPKAISPPELKESMPKLGYLFVALLGIDLIVSLVLGWRFLRHQSELLTYLQVVIGVLALVLALLLGITKQRKMTFEDVLAWLGTSRLWQGIISLVTIALLGMLFWPPPSQVLEQTNISPTPTALLQPVTPPQPTNQSTGPITPTITSTPTQWSPCQIESFAAEPPSPQPVGGLVIFKIRGTCVSGVRAIRLLINDEWYDEKGGHIAPPEEFVPTWSTNDLNSGDYKITAEVATWRDDEWAFAASQTLTYTLAVPMNSANGP